MNRTAPILLLLLAVLTACASSGAGSSPAPSEGEGGGAIEHPTAADEPILVVASEGGFVPVHFVATALPSFVLLGDGRVIMQGMQTLEFPGPALPPLIERTLSEEGIQAVLEAVGETNLFTSALELMGAQNTVADAPDAIFTLTAGRSTVAVRVYALGLLAPMPGEVGPGPAVEAPPGVTSGEMQAHAILAELNDRLLMLDTWLPADAWEDEGWQPYEPEALRLYVRDVTGEPREGGDMPEQVREWPIEEDPATVGEEQANFGDGTRCVVVEGETAEIWLAELHSSNQLTVWSDDGERRFSVMARPTLPHEEATCPVLTGA